MTYRQMAVFTMICALQVMIGNWVGVGGIGLVMDGDTAASLALFTGAIPGILALMAIIVGGVIIHALIPWKAIPTVAYITTLGCIVTVPGFPGAAALTAWTGKVSFVGLCTPILAYAGMAVGKDMDTLKTQGWRIVVVGLVVFVGTFMGSALIAEVVLRMMGQV